MRTEAVEGSQSLSAAPGDTRLGPYRLVQQLGEGGMGVVHLALDPHGRAVALKLLRPHIAHDPAARRRLAREVEVLQRIDDPRVAAVIDADLDGPRPYVVTRYIPGPALDTVVREGGPLLGEDLLRLGRGLAGAVDAIHAADVIHRDLKPGNVLLLDGEPVLIDFGIAHLADDIRITMTGLVMGTPGYLSPEVVEGAAVTEATDWWGWAATLAYAASGVPPFGRGPMEVVLSRVRQGEADLTGVDRRLVPLLSAALSPDPRQRPDADEVVAGLERYASGGPATQVVPARAPVPPRHTQVLDQRPTDAWDEPPPVPEPWTEPAVPELFDQWGQPDDGDAGWDAPQEGDPRIGRPNRSGVLVGLLLVLVALTATAPVVAFAALLAWSWVARTSDRSVTSLVLRRHRRGRRRSDVPVAVVAAPWHLVVAALATVASVLLPLLVGLCAVFSAALAMVAVAGGSPQPDAAGPLAVGGLLAALVAWWGPGGASLRRGTRSIVRGVTPGPATARVLALAALLAAVALGWWALSHGLRPEWWPTSGPGSLVPPVLGITG